jgi:hypothetical protein
MKKIYSFIINLIFILVCLPSFATTITSNGTGGGAWSSAATWSGGVVPANDEAVTIAPGDPVLMDVDTSGFADGLQTVTISGGVTPGMLYFKNGTSGYLKMKTGYNIIGTTSTNRGRLLANSDGVWATDTGLAFANKALIDLQGTSQITTTNLDIKLIGTGATNSFVRIYRDKYAVSSINTGTNVITCSGAHSWSANEPVCVRSSATLPGGLSADTMYYVGSPSGADLKLLYLSSGTEVDITSSGSGTIELYSGYSGSTYVNQGSTTPLNVLTDVTADNWVTTANHNYAVVTDIGPADYDIQGVTITTIAAAAITISANLDSAQYPLARLYYSSHNISIQGHCGSGTAQPILDYSSATTPTAIFTNCEIRNAAWGGGTTFYGRGINMGTGLTLTSCNLTGNSYGIYAGTGLTLTSCNLTGNNFGINTGTGLTLTSCNLTGNNYGINTGTGFTLTSCNLTGNSSGIYIGAGFTLTSCNLTGNSYGINAGTGFTILGGSIKNNINDFRLSGVNLYKCRNVDMTSSPVIYARNLAYNKARITMEDYLQVFGASKILDNFGDIYKTACDGTGDAPSIDPDGGHGYVSEVSSVQANTSSFNDLVIWDFDDMKLWMAAGTYTVTFKVQAAAECASGEIVLSASYLDGAVGGSRTIAVSNTTTIAARSADTDWTQSIAVTFTQAADGFVKFKLDLLDDDSDPLYIWPTPTIS